MQKLVQLRNMVNIGLYHVLGSAEWSTHTATDYPSLSGILTVDTVKYVDPEDSVHYYTDPSPFHNCGEIKELYRSGSCCGMPEQEIDISSLCPTL